ncbi:MAG TPA: alpha/beta fold hydrolase, partial [Isosphaeraceae bacterium]|nr:alpha/beta fold hydrolase [Isosphaeraceae bacterium]
MKRLTMLVTLVVGFSSALPWAAAEDDKAAAVRGVEGAWSGPLKISPQLELPITLELIRGKDGSLSGKWGSPDEALADQPFRSIAFRDRVLTFTMRHGASYKGTLNQSGTEIAGEWTHRGKTFPLTFQRFDPSKVVVVPIPRELEGIWEGKITAPGGIQLRLALKVEKAKDGALKAALASPDQGAHNIPISSIGLKEGVLTFASKIIGAKYTGKRNPCGTAFEGEFVQSGLKMPLTLKKTDKISQARRPQTPQPPFPYRMEDVVYENRSGGVKLAGTLTLPAGKGPVPAVILITGSGAQDRDETILGHKPFLVLADALTRRGIAVLRVDDRGVGGSTGSVKTSTSEDFAGDVLAGVAFLKGRSDIDAKKIGLIGHSEGGLIAPIAAARSQDVAFIVLMAGTGLPGTEILVAQGQLILEANGASESLRKLQRDAQKRLMDIITREKDETAARTKLTAAVTELFAALPESERKALGDAGAGLAEAAVSQANNAWFRFFLAFDPRPTLRQVRCPVLALNGAKDLQVPAKENLAEIAKALKAGGNDHVKTVELPGLNHLFQPSKTGSPSEYASI